MLVCNLCGSTDIKVSKNFRLYFDVMPINTGNTYRIVRNNKVTFSDGSKDKFTLSCFECNSRDFSVKCEICKSVNSFNDVKLVEVIYDRSIRFYLICTKCLDNEELLGSYKVNDFKLQEVYNE